MNYRNLLSEISFLRVKQRARQLTGSDLTQIKYNKNELVFKTRSSKDRKKIWTQRVVVSNLAYKKVRGKSVEKLIRNIKDSELRVSCDCPAFTFWGFKYIAWKRGYGIEKETRAPRVRNLNQKGYVCKHLYSVLQLYPYWAPVLARKFENALPKEEQIGSKMEEGKVQAINKLQHREFNNVTTLSESKKPDGDDFEKELYNE